MHGVEAFHGLGVGGGGIDALRSGKLGFGIDEIDFRQTEDVGRQGVVHVGGGMAGTLLVVVGVAVKMLHDIGACRRGEFATAAGIEGVVVDEAQVVETALVLPEVIVLEAGQHHRGFETGIGGIDPRVRSLFEKFHAKGLLQINRRGSPVAPAVAEFVEARHAKVRLQGVLCGPDVSVGGPTPGIEALLALVVGQAIDVAEILHERAARVLDDV